MERSTCSLAAVSMMREEKIGQLLPVWRVNALFTAFRTTFFSL